jgi:microsomal dipeptidase-like Zn-dependent dipeptidase
MASRARLSTWAALCAVALSCSKTYDPPGPCLVIGEPDAGVLGPDAGWPSGVVWGFADLHAHPAIEAAFQGNFIWGTALDQAPVNAAELPLINACPVETHVQGALSPVTRRVGELLYPQIANLAHYAHAPVGSLGARVTDSWPNARDVIHQQMNISSVRRAYEGGLRLMFASVTDDQVLSALLSGPNFVNGFVPDPEADLRSARAQLELITTIAAQNADWMGIATTPQQAREIIGQGRLALVLSLEMEGLRQKDVEALARDYPVKHIIPVHLVDNDVGGSAVNASLFNTATAMVSSISRVDCQPLAFMSVAATQDYPLLFGLPQLVVQSSPSVYINIEDVPYSWYAGLCYEPLDACSGPDAGRTSFIQYGQQNALGLTTSVASCEGSPLSGVARVQHFADDLKMIVDVSHMSARSVRDTLAAIDASVPVIASHGDVAHLCEGNPTDVGCDDHLAQPGPVSERSLDGEQARQVLRRGGVLGLGSGVGTYSTRPVFTARGVPLLSLSPTPGGSSACVTVPGADGGASVAGCEASLSVDQADAGMAIDTLSLQIVGGISSTAGNAHPFVRVELRDRVSRNQYQRRVILQPLDCSAQGCLATVPLGSQSAPVGPVSACTAQQCDATRCDAGSYTVDDLARVQLEWLYLQCDYDCQARFGSSVAARQCTNTWDDDQAPSWTLEQVSLSASAGAGPASPLATLGPRASAPWAILDRHAGAFTAYQREDRPSATPVLASGRLLRISMKANAQGDGLPGASPSAVGANACIALRQRVDGGCVTPPAPAAGATECPPGWTSLNQRGSWATGGELYTFVRIPGSPSDVCGVDLSIIDWDPASAPFGIDEVRVEAAEDPVGRWVRRYAEVERYAASSRAGALAFGTDLNGFNGTTDISEQGVPAGALAPSSCGASDAGPLPLAPLRIRNPDGTLGASVLIDERGLATYGMLADWVAVVRDYPGCGEQVYDSLMLSAEATLRAWEAIDTPDAGRPPPLPSLRFDTCQTPPGVGP